MTIDPRIFIENDKRLPEGTDLGDAGKVLAVNAAGDGYELVAPGGTYITGSIIMWPLDVPPSGYLMCDGVLIPAEHSALIALIGTHTPTVIFAKNSVGVNTNTQEAEDVGAHGHSMEAIADHTHSVSVQDVGNHRHLWDHCTGTGSDAGNAVRRQDNDCANRGAGDYAGAHNHVATAGNGGGHTPVVEDHAGTNQPACTLLNFCIKT